LRVSDRVRDRVSIVSSCPSIGIASAIPKIGIANTF